AGKTTYHHYLFPAGSSLPASSFTALYSATAKLSLSNSGSQVGLLDPLGHAVSVTAPYGTADDGQAWALAKGQWYWTTSATPGAANSIKQPSAKPKSKSSKSKTTKSTTTKLSSAGTHAAAASAGSLADDIAAKTPIHPWALALVASLALLYVGY